MKKTVAKLNIPLFMFMFLYSIFGLIMIFSASNVAAVLRYKVSTNYFFIRQLIFLVIGYVGGLIILLFPTRSYRYFSKIAMFGIIFLLFFLFFEGIVAGGAQSWYDLGFFNFQPAEFAKIIMIVYLSVYYHRISTKKNVSFWSFIFPMLLCGIVFFLIAMQPDFGGAFIIFLIAFMIFCSLPFCKPYKKIMYMVGGVGIGVILVSVLVFGKSILHGYQVSRILNFTNPCERYADDTGYQVCNGYIAIHNGGLFGVGLGESTQKYLYLPEAHTDFIFPIICEELGILVGLLLVFGYFVMLFLILKVAKEADNIRNSILAYGVFSYLLAHILINLLGVLGLIPLTGVPLPFLSYGGSYNLCVLIALFMVQAVHMENQTARQRRKIENL